MSQSVDIMQQFITQFKKENVLGFFQFHHSFEGKKPVSGLCKIAKAKKASASIKYLSLVFLVDAPNAETKKAIDGMLNKLAAPTTQRHLSEIESITPMPAMNANPESYVKHLDIMLKQDTAIDRDFIENRLCPVIRAVTGFTVMEDIIWWEDIDITDNVKKDRSILEKITSFFKH